MKNSKTMTKQEIIEKAKWDLLAVTFSHPIVDTSKPVQRAIEHCDPQMDIMKTTECAVTFNNAYSRFYKRIENVKDVIKIKSKINA